MMVYPSSHEAQSLLDMSGVLTVEHLLVVLPQHFPDVAITARNAPEVALTHAYKKKHAHTLATP